MYKKHSTIKKKKKKEKKRKIQFSYILDESVNLTLVEDVHLREAELH